MQCPLCKSDNLSEEIQGFEMKQYKCLSCNHLFESKMNDQKQVAMKFIQKHSEEITQYIKSKEIEQYKGKKVFCPICSSGFQRFAPAYAWIKSEKDNVNELECIIAKDNARCPNCNSLERHRLLWLYLHEKTNIFDNRLKRLLDFAPDEFFFNDFVNNKAIDYYPCDLDPEKNKFKSYQGDIIKEDITQLSFADNYFDAILCSHVLEHVVNDRHAMAELRRVMKKDGWGIIQLPVDYTMESTYEDDSIASDEGREKAFGQKDHVRRYGKDIIKRLSDSGFRVTEDLYVNSFSAEEIAKYGLDKYEVIYLLCS